MKECEEVKEQERPVILLVDDEPRFRLSLAKLLEDNYTVLTAADGQEGLTLFESAPVSLTLLDLDMPVMNGVEMLERLRAGTDDAKVIVMTGRSTHGWAKSCANLNVQGYIEKPFEIDDLVARMKDVLGEGSSSKGSWLQQQELRMEKASPFITEVVDYIHDNCKESSTQQEIASRFNRSTTYLARRFHAECGMPMKAYVTRYKIEKGRELLEREPTLMIQDVASAVGIPDANYFSRLFTRVVGESPGRFRTRCRSITDG